MTRGELIFSVSRKLGLDDSVGSDELTLMQRWANDGVKEVLLRTHARVQIGEMFLTADVSEYRLDTTILAIDDGKGSAPAGIGRYQLVPLAELIDRQAAGSIDTSLHKKIGVYGDLMIVSPTPEADETLTFYYVPEPTAMTLDTHDPSDATYGGIAKQYHRAIEYYMLWQGAEYDDKGPAGAARELQQQFEKECGLVRKRMRRLGNRRLPQGRIGYPSQFGLSRRNDVYPR